MDVYLVNPACRPFVISGGVEMTIYLAGEHPVKNGSIAEPRGGLNILESFYYVRNNRYFPKLYPYFDNFMLDSGAFTFVFGAGGKTVNWDKYAEDYAEFINRYGIKLYFELDIDKLAGIEKVEKLRDRLESLTGVKPIPVWHENRSKEYYTQMCRNYPYVAIVGVAALKGEEKKRKERLFPWFIKTAHENCAKIHGLGYTSIENLKLYHFDSVDSKAWLHGNIGGWLYRFNPTNGLMEKWEKSKGGRMKSQQAAIHNFNEWVKFCDYAKYRL